MTTNLTNQTKSAESPEVSEQSIASPESSDEAIFPISFECVIGRRPTKFQLLQVKRGFGQYEMSSRSGKTVMWLNSEQAQLPLAELERQLNEFCKIRN